MCAPRIILTMKKPLIIGGICTALILLMLCGGPARLLFMFDRVSLAGKADIPALQNWARPFLPAAVRVEVQKSRWPECIKALDPESAVLESNGTLALHFSRSFYSVVMVVGINSPPPIVYTKDQASYIIDSNSYIYLGE